MKKKVVSLRPLKNPSTETISLQDGDEITMMKKKTPKEEYSIMRFLEIVNVVITERKKISNSKKLSYNKELSDKAILKGILHKDS